MLVHIHGNLFCPFFLMFNKVIIQIIERGKPFKQCHKFLVRTVLFQFVLMFKIQGSPTINKFRQVSKSP